MPPGMPSLPIRYDNATNTLSFTGLMSNAERLALNAAGNPAAAIDELFRQPRLAVKFYQPVFEAPLETMPPALMASLRWLMTRPDSSSSGSS